MAFIFTGVYTAVAIMAGRINDIIIRFGADTFILVCF
jgi:hypothetical protein